MRRFAPILLLVALVAGCSDEAVPGTAGASSAVASAAASDDPPGSLTCGRLNAAVRGATLMQPGVIDGVVAAAVTADAPVADAAQRLGTAYAAAVAAKGGENEPDAIAAVSAAAADLAAVCSDSGLETAG